MDSHSIADAMDRAAALLAVAAEEVHVGYDPYNPLRDVRWLGRVALFWAQLPWITIVCTLVVLLGSVSLFIATNQTRLINKFDKFVTRKVLTKMRQKLSGEVTIGTVKVRPTTVTVEDLTLGNPPTAEFSAPFLVSMKQVHCKLNPLSILGVKGKGNFVVGYLCGEVQLMSVTGATVYLDEVPDPNVDSLLSTKKIRNFQNLKRQTLEAAAAERAREEAALLLLQEEKRIVEEASANLKKQNPNSGSLFSTIGDTFTSASNEIEKQLAEVNKQANKLGSTVAGSIQAAGADVTNRLNALITLLERVNQKPPEETEEEKRRKKKLTLELAKLEFADWEIYILAVNKSPFKFKKWELEKFKGVVGALARECASGLLNEIILDFQNEILENLTKDIAAVGDGLLNVGGAVVGGGAFVVGGVASGVGAVGQGLVDTGGAIGKGLADTGAAVGQGLSDTGAAVGQGLSDTGEALGKGISDTTEAVTGFFGFSSASKETVETVCTTTSVSTLSTSEVVSTTATVTAVSVTAAVEEEKKVEKEKRTKKETEEAELAARAIQEAEEKLAREDDIKRAAEAEKKADESKRQELEKQRLQEEERIAAAAIAKAEAEAEAEIAKQFQKQVDGEKLAWAKEQSRMVLKIENEKSELASIEGRRRIRERSTRDLLLSDKIVQAELAIAEQKAARQKEESVAEQKKRNERDAKQRRLLVKIKKQTAGGGVSESESDSEDFEDSVSEPYSPAASMRSVGSYGSFTSRNSSRDSSPVREPYLIRVKYLSGVFDIVDVDGTGKMKIKTFLKALKKVPKVDALMKKGKNAGSLFNSDEADERTASAFDAFERDKNKIVDKEEFITYFLFDPEEY
ncbi:hypothetical protein OAD67_00080 [bacterium]|nr:hypothetical protein [bacterium]